MFSRYLTSRLAALLLLISAVLVPSFLAAQTGGEGAIQGTVTDSTGAVVPDATVTITNTATGGAKVQSTSSKGVYAVSPLLPGPYMVQVSATGFNSFRQDNVIVNALQVVGLNVSLKVGNQSEVVEVSTAPPSLETANATLGATMTTSSYEDLPVTLSVGGPAGLQQRDITQISNLMPGAQTPPGGRSSIIGGTAQRLGELYVDGLPITTANQQGDNRPVFNIIPLEGINQVQVVTSGYSAEYQGSGLENYNTASGGNQYHGAVFLYNRNTVFDAWTFASKPGGFNTVKQVVNGVVTTVPGPKPAERQNEYGFKVGGPVRIPHLFNGHDKLFFFAAYDKFTSFSGVNPSSTSVPTTLMRTGDFTELLTANGGPGYNIYDPSTLNCPTASTCTRQQYKGIKNGLPTANVIPAGEISPISQYMQQWLPQPQVAGLQNNWVGGIPSGYNNWLYSGRFDLNISAKQTLSGVIAGGNRHAIPYTGTTNILPVPYLNDTGSIVAGHWADLEHSYSITAHLVNQIKFGFMNFGGPPVINLTASDPKYSGGSAGITGLPAGQASTNFPISTFSGNSNNPVQWSGGTQSTAVNETFTLLDNLLWVKGKHAITMGFQYQWLQNNQDSTDGYSNPVTLAWNSNETANINGTSYTTGAAANSGYAFASYMVGAVSSSGLTVQPFSVVGGRFKPFAPYFQDDYKVNSKLTLNLGLRWDYLPTYVEAQDRWSFLNPAINNPITLNPGALQFAGNHGGPGVSCGCRTPVNNYYKNWGPRVGFAFSANDKTVFRGGFGTLYSHAGGTGGITGSYNGTGNSGFTSTVSFPDGAAGPGAAPAFWLNTQSTAAFGAAAATGGNTFQPSQYAPNTNMGGPTYTLPAIAPPGAVSQGLLTGNFVCTAATVQYPQCNGIANGGFGGTGSGINYADPYIAGRAPEFNFWNFGMQREITTNITISVNYAGSQGHFLTGASNIRGLYSGEMDPKWFPLASATASSNYLGMAATAGNIAAAQTATGLTLPSLPFYQAAAQTSTKATIAHMLTWMPQFSGTTDTWPDVANSNYNAFQMTFAKRYSGGSSFTVNYTYSKNIDDAGTQRSGYALPASATLTGKSWAANRIDRSLSVNSQPQNLTVFGVYALPFGKGGIGADNAWVRALAGGWKLSGISQYSSGLPLAITANCAGIQGGSLGQGQCMPDINPSFTGNPRINGGWGSGITAATLGTKSYIYGYIPQTTAGNGTNGSTTTSVACASSNGPFCNSNNYMVGDAARVAPFGLRGQGLYRLNLAVRRDIPIVERLHFIFGVDCANVTNHVTFGNNAQNNQIVTNVNAGTTFGTLVGASADSRAFQFSGRLEF